MKKTLRLLTICALTGLVAACGSKEKTDETAAASTQAAPATVPTTETSTEPAATPATPPSPDATFDLSSVPVSGATLGQFPYLSGLQGYSANSSNSEEYEFERAYVYDGKNLVPVEGKMSQRLFGPDNSDKKASELMIRRNYEALLKSLEATKVSAAAVPREVIEKVGQDEVYKHGKWSISTDHETDTYLIRQKDKEVWVQVTALGSDGNYNLNVTERAAMPQQATILPAAELNKN